MCFYVEGDIELFVSELNTRGISNSPDANPNCVKISGVSNDELIKIKDDLFGESPPEGLHVGWPITATGVVDGVEFELDESKRIMDRLKDEEIQTSFVTYHGIQYLVWDEKDNEAVTRIINNQ